VAGAKAAATAGSRAAAGATGRQAAGSAAAGRAAAGRAVRGFVLQGGRRTGSDGGPGSAAKLAAAALAALLGFLLLILAPFLLTQGAATTLCGEPLDDSAFQGPGSLGGVGGTGVTREEHRRLRQHPSSGGRPASGSYVSTAYGPPWNALNGYGVTAGGIDVRDGPEKYIVAVDPSRVPIGSPVYLWPNPFGWKGPFIAADTGGAIVGARIDFYDWRGRATQYAWGTRSTRLGLTPAQAQIPGGGKPVLRPPGGGPVSSGATYDVACTEGAGDLSFSGERGEAEVASYALAPKPIVIRYVQHIHGIVGGRPIVITSGYRPDSVTTSGNVSDHAYGLAADIGNTENGFPYARGNPEPSRGDRIAAAAMVIAGMKGSAAYELARSGGAHTLCAKGRLRVQLIWRSDVGGDHYDHVHVGLKPGGCTGSGHLYTTR
jgi:3D (Asp-Asp-Asp) domain-containing protein